MRFFLELSYKGTSYHGWQIQENAVSVQQKVNEALSTVFQREILTVGSGRTDAGVHAAQQFVHFDHPEAIDEDLLLHKLNGIMPKDIAAKSLRPVNVTAHTRFDATLRSYEYKILKKKDPFHIDQAYFFNKTVDIKEMNEAAKMLLSTEDFQCFSKVKTDVNNFLCTVSQAEWKIVENGDNEILIFSVSANRFLRGMVRAIVGTLLEVGLGRLSIDDFSKILSSQDRKQAGRSVPADGLFLTEVKYPDAIFINSQN